jgi:hypothetical protein
MIDPGCDIQERRSSVDAPVELPGDAFEKDEGHWSASTFFASIPVRPATRTVVARVHLVQELRPHRLHRL